MKNREAIEQANAIRDRMRKHIECIVPPGVPMDGWDVLRVMTETVSHELLLMRQENERLRQRVERMEYRLDWLARNG